MYSTSSVQSLTCIQLFATWWTAAHQASLSVTNFSELAQTHVHRVGDAIQPSHPVVPFSFCLQFFLASGSFLMSQFFTSGDQSIGVSTSASVPPMNTQDWSPLRWTVVSPYSPRASQESFPTPQFKSINSSVLSFLHNPTLTSIHDYWKNYSFD